MSGAVAYHGGLAAEDTVARTYETWGYILEARRWRSEAGEIDLIARKDGVVVFIEVKRAKDFATAAWRLAPKQAARILSSAELFLGSEPGGTDTPARVDVALVDAQGAVKIIENALSA